MRKLLLGLALLLGVGLSPTLAYAQSPNPICVQYSYGCIPVTPSAPLPVAPYGTAISGTVTAVTLGTTAQQVVAANQAKVGIDITNASPPGGATIYCSVNSTPVANAAGTYPIPPQWHKSWPEAGIMPTEAVLCIASLSNTPMTLQVR